ncbi:unnamed protein product [Orchesella dallaii]|uniref:nicotinamidase n=1 Tax=Orchesella dallaii TaxID=48710 RepID=A0ABP1S6B4_9HEXA
MCKCLCSCCMDKSEYWKSAAETLKKFDKNRDDGLDFKEFSQLCRALFKNSENSSYPVKEDALKTMFHVFDRDSNGVIDQKEFDKCYNGWIKKILSPVSALVVVDVQNDFISGSLALKNSPAKQDGAEVIGPINRMLNDVTFNKVFYSMDWHPENHISFVENVHLWKLDKSCDIQDPKEARVFDVVIFEGPNQTIIEQKLWPKHCVQDTWGAQLHEELKVIPEAVMIKKGTSPDKDSYSALFDNTKKAPTDLVKFLEANEITDVYVCGLATDVCVGATIKDALLLGYRTVFVEEASRGITLEGITGTKRDISQHQAVIVKTNEVKNMVNGIDRRPELGLKLAMTIEIQRRNKKKVK